MSLPNLGYSHKKATWIALAVLALAVVAVFAPGASARSFAPASSVASPIPYPPLAVWMTVDASNQDPNVFGVTVYAQSATDMPVPYVKAVVTTCRFGQQRPFVMAHRTRHLDPQQETLLPFNGGQSLSWYMFSAPADTAQPAKLTLDFLLPAGGSGPTFCVSVSGYTDEASIWTTPVSITWGLK
jgi:hypothetical protein